MSKFYIRTNQDRCISCKACEVHCKSKNRVPKGAKLGILVSTGPNGAASPPAGSDEARNQDGDAAFVHRAPAEGSGEAFDDRVRWIPIHLVVSRLVSAGRLP